MLHRGRPPVASSGLVQTTLFPMLVMIIPLMFFLCIPFMESLTFQAFGMHMKKPCSLNPLFSTTSSRSSLIQYPNGG